jgi:hypothetical protein
MDKPVDLIERLRIADRPGDLTRRYAATSPARARGVEFRGCSDYPLSASRAIARYPMSLRYCMPSQRSTSTSS